MSGGALTSTADPWSTTVARWGGEAFRITGNAGRQPTKQKFATARSIVFVVPTVGRLVIFLVAGDIAKAVFFVQPAA